MWKWPKVLRGDAKIVEMAWGLSRNLGNGGGFWVVLEVEGEAAEVRMVGSCYTEGTEVDTERWWELGRVWGT